MPPDGPRRTAVLRELASEIGDDVVALHGDRGTVVHGLSCSQARLLPRHLYFVVGPAGDARAAARAAVAGGAAALCVAAPTGTRVPELVVRDVRTAMARLSAAFYGHPARDLALLAVTGTLGKTTTAWLLESILAAAGRRAGLIGSITARVAGAPEWIGGTTPEAPELHRVLAGMRAAGVKAVALEVSSHALVLERVHGLRFAASAFTNLSRDHLDLHGDMRRYFAAKRSLFEPARTDRAAIGIDDRYGRALAHDIRVPMLTFGLDERADVRATDVALRDTGSAFLLATPHGKIRVATRLLGRASVRNCLAAAATALQVGIPLDAVARGLARIETVPGRAERIDLGQPFAVVVDYARTARALHEALRTARLLTRDRGSVRCVFGCWGDGDREKRERMGAVAARLADHVVLTLDSPRDEDPLAIVRDIRRGIRRSPRRAVATVVLDRREAIARAIGDARPGDAVVIAGRGLERAQIILGRDFDLDDRDVARDAIEARQWELRR